MNGGSKHETAPTQLKRGSWRWSETAHLAIDASWQQVLDIFFGLAVDSHDVGSGFRLEEQEGEALFACFEDVVAVDDLF